jgi:hypothetical protein
MAFSSRRGRPPKPAAATSDPGTAELRLKHALGLTAEPIDRCLERQLITPAQHWCGLHLRWLYTIRYGAPIVTTRYAADSDLAPRADDDPQWRNEREREYAEARIILRERQFYEPVMRLCIYNESPVFLSDALRKQAWQQPALAKRLEHAHRTVCAGLDLLAVHWKRR